jgi:hypothetical protein
VSRDEDIWRVSLESPLTGERKGFASLDALVVFLRSEMADKTSPLEEEQYLETQPNEGES